MSTLKYITLICTVSLITDPAGDPVCSFGCSPVRLTTASDYLLYSVCRSSCSVHGTQSFLHQFAALSGGVSGVVIGSASFDPVTFDCTCIIHPKNQFVNTQNVQTFASFFYWRFGKICGILFLLGCRSYLFSPPHIDGA